jgi:hypothetical protein
LSIKLARPAQHQPPSRERTSTARPYAHAARDTVRSPDQTPKSPAQTPCATEPDTDPLQQGSGAAKPCPPAAKDRAQPSCPPPVQLVPNMGAGFSLVIGINQTDRSTNYERPCTTVIGKSRKPCKQSFVTYSCVCEIPRVESIYGCSKPHSTAHAGQAGCCPPLKTAQWDPSDSGELAPPFLHWLSFPRGPTIS